MGRRKKIKKFKYLMKQRGMQHIPYEKDNKKEENKMHNNKNSNKNKNKCEKIVGGVYIMKTPFTESNITSEGIRKQRPVIILKKITTGIEHKNNNYLCLPLSTRLDIGVKILLGDVLNCVPVHLMCTLFDEDLTNKVLHIIPEKYMEVIKNAVEIYLDDNMNDIDKRNKLKTIPLYYETSFDKIMSKIFEDVSNNYMNFEEKRNKNKINVRNHYQTNVIINKTYNIHNNQNCKINVDNDIDITEILKKYPKRFQTGIIKISGNYNEVPKLSYREIMEIFNVSRSSAYQYITYMNQLRDDLSK